jgi:hypothetical protein
MRCGTFDIFARVQSVRTTAKRNRPIALLATAWVFSYSLNAQELKASLPNLDLILDALERTQAQNPSLSRSYEVTRQYKVFRGEDPNPSSEATAQISFTQKNRPICLLQNFSASD